MIRLDVLVSKNKGCSRAYAKELIINNHVYVSGKPETRPGKTLEDDTEIIITEPDVNFVSRGGYKLEKAVKYFEIDLDGLVCVDVGASTGGFTDCMLQNGAAKVYAIDVGTAQLSPILAQNPRVISIEQTNIRDFDSSLIPEKCGFASIDVSFVSVTKVLANVRTFLYCNEMICLIKPQFEAGRDRIPKSGVVKNPKLHLKILKEIFLFAKDNDLAVSGIIGSPIKGEAGNKEFLLYFSDKKPMTYKSYMEAAESAVGEVML